MVVLRHVWRSRWFMVTAAVAGLLLALAALFAFRSVGPAEISYNSAIVITFPNRESGTYPNGVSYSPTDLLSPTILSEVYERNGLEEAGVELTDLMSYVTVAPYSPLTDSLAARYRQRLADRNISFEERRAVEAEFSDQLAAQARNSLLISLQVPVTSPITAAMASKILADIPAAWSDIYVNRLGAVAFGAPVSGGILVDETLLGSLDYPLQFDYLQEQAERASDRIDNISKLPGADGVLSQETGKSVSDLRRDLDALGEFVINRVMEPVIDEGIARNPEQTVLSYEHAIRQLQLKKQSSDARAKAVSGVLKDVDSQAAQLASEAAPQASGSLPVVTQMDSSLVDRIIALSSQGQEFGYRRQLLGDKLTIENESIDVADSIERISARIGAIKARAASGLPERQSIEVFENGEKIATASLNAIWDDINRLHAQLGSDQLSQDKLLYKPLSLDEDKRVVKTPLLSNSNAAFIVAFTLAGAVLGFLFYLSRINAARPAR